MRDDDCKNIFPERLLGDKDLIELGDGKETGEEIESNVEVFEFFVFHDGPELNEDEKTECEYLAEW